MATEAGYDDPIGALLKVACHDHPLGCPPFTCRECHRPTASRADSGLCFDCLAARAKAYEPGPVELPICDGCGLRAPIAATVIGSAQRRTASFCAACARKGRE